MSVLVDTSVWSEFLRRRTGKPSPVRGALAELIDAHNIAMIGPVRQELLSGIRQKKDFELLRERLRAFPDHAIGTAEYELAAEFFNKFRGRGVQGSFIDFLICSVASQNKFRVYSLDKDFLNYARWLPIKLFKPRAG